jgi:hypothetical protein
MGSQRVAQIYFMQAGFAYKEYEELVGRLGPDGKPYPLQGVLRCAEVSYGSLLDYFKLGSQQSSGARLEDNLWSLKG